MVAVLFGGGTGGIHRIRMDLVEINSILFFLIFFCLFSVFENSDMREGACVLLGQRWNVFSGAIV